METEKELEKIAFELSEKGEFVKASELFEELGHNNHGYYSFAAYNAGRAGDIERAINLYEKKGSELDIECAVSLALRAGMVERALRSGEKRVLSQDLIDDKIKEVWRRNGVTVDFDATDYVVRVAQNHELYGLAIEVAEKYGKPETVSRTYLMAAGKARDRGDFEKAAELAEKAGDFRFAALNAKSAGLIDRAIGLLERSGEFYDAARMALDIRRGFPDIVSQVYRHTLSVPRGTLELKVEKRDPQQTVDGIMIDRARQLYEKAIAQSKELLSQINDDNYTKNGQGNYTGLLRAAEDAMSVGLDDVAQQMIDITEQIHQAYIQNNWTWIFFP